MNAAPSGNNSFGGGGIFESLGGIGGMSNAASSFS